MLSNKLYSKFFILFYSVLTFIIGVIITPPYQSPDEFYHFQRAYAIANGQITPSATEYLDKAMMKMLSMYEGLPYRSENKVTHTLENDAKNLAWENDSVIDEAANTNIYLPIIYTPQVLGVLVGKILDLSLYNTYFLSKILTLLFSMFILYYASVKYRISSIALFVLSLPMVMFQLGSTNPDGIIFALSVLIGAISAKGLDITSNFTNKDFYLLLLLIFICVTVKFNMLPLFILPFFITYRRNVKSGMIYSAVTVLLALIWTMLVMKLTASPEQAHFKGNAVDNIFYYIANLDKLLHIFKNTFFNKEYLISISEMFVGVLGWLDTKFELYQYQFFYSVFLFSFILFILNLKNKWREILLGVVLIILILVFTHFILLVTWNNLGVTQVSGVQGRYFIPIFLIVFSFFPNIEGINSNIKLERGVNFLSFIFLLISSFMTIDILIDRYYMG